MSKTTRETRRKSYEEVLPKVKDRARLILETLGSKEMTVSEITDQLVEAACSRTSTATMWRLA